MKWIYKRIINSVVAWVAAISIAFIMVKVMPGNIINVLIINYVVNYHVPYQQAVQMVTALVGYPVNQPLWQAYISYITNLLHGNFGRSINYDTPVSVLVANTLPWTLLLVVLSLLVSVGLGIFVGLAMAYYRNKAHLVNGVKLGLSVLNAFPNFVLGVIFFYYIGYTYHLLPYEGAYSPGVVPGLNLNFIGSVLSHYILPVLTMSLTLFPGWAFSTMGTATSVLKDDYVTAAKARGLPSRRILFSYVAKNSILPIYTSIPISLAFLLAGAVWIESIFELPGMGYYLSVALGVRDYPLIMGYYFVIITALILGNLFTDFTYSLVDPRAKVE